jgi:MFS family permease
MSAPDARSARLATALLGCFVCQMGLGCGYVFGATLKHIVAEFAWSRTAFAAASAPLLLAMALSSPVVGAGTERWGARTVLSGATVLLSLSLWLMSRMQSLWEFYAASAVFGVALTGLGDIAVGAVASRWVAHRRGLALGLVYVGSNVGGALVPVGAEAIAAQASWREALQVVGGVALVAILPFALFAIREPPGEAGGVDASGGSGSADAPHDDDLDLAAALRTRSFWILAFVLFGFYFYYLAVSQHLVAFLSDVGFSDARAAASLSFAVLLGVASKLGIGLIADRFAVKRALLANFAVLAAASFLLLFVAERPGLLLAFLVAHGFATAAENVLLPMAVAECFGVRHLARIYGMLMLMLFPGGVLGPVFAGAVFDERGAYGLAFASFAVLNVLGLAALPALRDERGLRAGRPSAVAARGARGRVEVG